MSYKLELQSNNTDIQTILDKVNALPEYVDYSDDIEAFKNSLILKGLTVPEESSLTDMIRLTEDNLSFVLKDQKLTGSHSYSSATDVGVGRWNVPFTSITSNEIISLSNGTFTCKTDIKQLSIGCTVYMQCGSTGACYIHLVSGGTTKSSGSGGASAGDKTMNYSWEDIPAGTTFYFQTSSSGSNGPTKYLKGSFTLSVIL